jgi:galacturan 1,4-alpha-galacturonidase
MAFKPGANNVTVDTISCSGSHVLSVGSLGEINTDVVENIYVTNADLSTSAKAVGVKVWPGGYGHCYST